MLTRDEQLKFCRRCLNRKFDMQQGLICSLTNQKAAFEQTCPDYNEDSSVKIEPIDEEEEAYVGEKLKSKLSIDAFEKLKLEQDLVFAIGAGFVASIVSAILWGMITVSTGYQIGYMALGVGALVGWAVRFGGKGIEQIYGIIGGFLALFGCIFGNILSLVGFISQEEGLGIFEVLFSIRLDMIFAFMGDTFSPIDLVFYVLAVLEGYAFSFRKITEADIARIKTQENNNN